jgi:hypothetical protein
VTEVLMILMSAGILYTAGAGTEKKTKVELSRKRYKGDDGHQLEFEAKGKDLDRPLSEATWVREAGKLVPKGRTTNRITNSTNARLTRVRGPARSENPRD